MMVPDRGSKYAESHQAGPKTCQRIFDVPNQGSGKRIYAWQKATRSLLATAIDGFRKVIILNRQGGPEHEVEINGNCSSLGWDEEGDTLAIIVDGRGSILLWESQTGRLQELETKIKDPATGIAWSKVGKTLAYVTSKGNLLIYDHKTMRKYAMLGKHKKGIVCCGWSMDSVLVLGTEDCQLSINTDHGEPVKTIQLSNKPRDLNFGQLGTGNGRAGDKKSVVSLIIGNRTLYLLPLSEDPGVVPLELGFQPSYGHIVTHHWHGTGFIWASFSNGFLVQLSTNPKELGTELALVDLGPSADLRWTALSEPKSQLCICAGEACVEFRSTGNPDLISAIGELEESGLLSNFPTSCEFSEDGQLLAVLRRNGELNVFLTSVPLLGSSSNRYIVHMGSLTNVVVLGIDEAQVLTHVQGLGSKTEPSSIVMGPGHVCLVFNDQVHFFSVEDFGQRTDQKQMPLIVKEYSSNVSGVSLNSDYAATLSGPQIFLHSIEAEGEEGRAEVFEENDEVDGRIMCMCMTKEYLVYGTNCGILKLFNVPTWAWMETKEIRVNPEFEVRLKSIHPDLTGCHYVIIDRDGCGYFFDLKKKKESVTLIESFAGRVDVVLWDKDEGSKEIFVTYSRGTSTIDVFIVWTDIDAQKVHHIETVRVFSSLDNLPLLLLKGVIYFQTSDGRIDRTVSIYTERPDLGKSPNRLGETLAWLLGLRKYEEAYALCEANEVNSEAWSALARSAAMNTNLEYAIKAFIRAGEYGSALSLYELLEADDLYLTQGHIALVLGHHDLAENNYLLSFRPHQALYMRCDLRQWEAALQLALAHRPSKCASICLEYGQHEEEANNCLQALSIFEQARDHALEFDDLEAVERADCGIARNALRSGHISRGLETVQNSRTPSLALECAEILETTKFFNEAAMLFEKAGEYDRAASLFIRNRQWDRVAAILPEVQSNKVYLQYAKAKEAEGSHLESAQVYEDSGNLTSAVRLYLKSGHVNEAVRIAKAACRPEVSAIVSEYYDEKQDFVSGVQFLLSSQAYEEALKLGVKYGKYELYADLCLKYVEEEAPDGLMPILIADGITLAACHFKSVKDYFRGGKYYFMAGDPETAYKILMKGATAGLIHNEDELMTLLIEVTLAICKFNKKSSVQTEFVDFLLGKRDGLPKDLKYLLEFYSRGKFVKEAAMTCLIYCKDELQVGNVDTAHGFYLQTIENLRDGSHRQIPHSLYHGLKVVHFLQLGKIHSGFGYHEMAARLFKTVLNHYEDFPQQAVGILTTTIIESYKCALQETAVAACCEVLKPEFRGSLGPEYIEKFEFIVRKQGRFRRGAVDIDDLISACPNCNADLPNYDLFCKACETEIPYCIMSGRHLVVDDFMYCPYCEFPGIKSEFIRLSVQLYRAGSYNIGCPMCQNRFSAKDLKEEYDLEDYLNSQWIGPKMEA